MDGGWSCGYFPSSQLPREHRLVAHIKANTPRSDSHKPPAPWVISQSVAVLPRLSNVRPGLQLQVSRWTDQGPPFLSPLSHLRPSSSFM